MVLHSRRWWPKKVQQAGVTYPTSAAATARFVTSSQLASMPTSASIAVTYVTSAACVPRFVTSAYADVTFVKSS